MSLIWRVLPPDWPAYTDLTGHQWRLSSNGYWWLRYGRAWHQASSPEATHVLGEPVPPAVLRGNKHWTTAQSDTDESWEVLRVWFEERIIATMQTPSSYLYYGGSGSRNTTFHDGLAHPVPAAPAPSANIPPDFAEIPPGPDCCRQCHLDDGPLYEGGLCRYCWMLGNVTAVKPAPALAQRHPPGEPEWKDRAVTALFVFCLLAMLGTIVYFL